MHVISRKFKPDMPMLDKKNKLIPSFLFPMCGPRNALYPKQIYEVIYDSFIVIIQVYEKLWIIGDKQFNRNCENINDVSWNK